MPIEPILARGLPLDGMVLTGPGGVRVAAATDAGCTGRSLSRRELDVLLIEHAIAAGAQVEDGDAGRRAARSMPRARSTGVTAETCAAARGRIARGW